MTKKVLHFLLQKAIFLLSLKCSLDKPVMKGALMDK